jgi:hypothetical protein
MLMPLPPDAIIYDAIIELYYAAIFRRALSPRRYCRFQLPLTLFSLLSLFIDIFDYRRRWPLRIRYFSLLLLFHYA